MAGAFTLGIEEEYFLVDAETKCVVRNMPQAFLEAAKAAANGRISPEFLQPQIEVISSPHDNMADARAELRELRRTIAAVAGEHGLAIMAAGTHPTATWRTARQTEKERYDNVMHDLQMIGQRDLLCGLHVHVELPDPDDRVDVMCRMLPYLPLFLALSTSSPFWQSRCTGLKGYRLAAYDELCRSHPSVNALLIAVLAAQGRRLTARVVRLRSRASRRSSRRATSFEIWAGDSDIRRAPSAKLSASATATKARISSSRSIRIVSYLEIVSCRMTILSTTVDKTIFPPTHREYVMSKIQTSDYAPHLLGALRIVAGVLFLAHGLVKVAGFPEGAQPGQQPLVAQRSGRLRAAGHRGRGGRTQPQVARRV